MEGVIFIGVQASGKSTFYKENFFTTHLRINLDMLKNRHREKVIFEAAIQAKQSLVIDNTNPRCIDRARYIPRLRGAGYTITGYCFQSDLKSCIARNNARLGTECINVDGIKYTYSILEVPTLREGFDRLYFVSMTDTGFFVKEWR